MNGVGCSAPGSVPTRYVSQPRLTLHKLELPSPTAAHSNVPDLAHLHEIVKRLHCLFNRTRIVESVTLKHIDIIQLKAFKG